VTPVVNCLTKEHFNVAGVTSLYTSVRFLLSIVSSVLLGFIDSNYSFGIIKPFLMTLLLEHEVIPGFDWNLIIDLIYCA
jgi:hypothetical protein